MKTKTKLDRLYQRLENAQNSIFKDKIERQIVNLEKNKL